MRRYEFKEGSSNKFWEISLEGEWFTTRFGRIGTEGQSSRKEFYSTAEARRAYDKIIAEKEKKGYRLVSGEAVSKVKTARNPALEAAIFEDPHDHAPYLVYGDWLQAQGDPRGELVAVQAALLEKPKDAKLIKKERELIGLGGTLLDTLLPGVLEIDGADDELDLVWRFGFLESVAIGGDDYSEIDGEGLARAILALPSAMFLRKLIIRVYGTDAPETDYAPTIKALAQVGLPKSLRSLAFSIENYQISWSDLGNLGPLYPALGGLEELFIKMGRMKLGTMSLPSLRKLEIVTGGLTRDNMKSITSAKWPKLETLTLYFGDKTYGANCKIADIRPVLDGKIFPKVKHLALANAEFADELAAAIPRAKIVRQLDTLDLSQGMMTDAGAESLIAGARSLSHLSKLDVSKNWLSEATQKRLKKTFDRKIEIGAQGNSASDERYVQVAE